MQATVYSKSVLRAVAGEMSSRYDDVDYFPSYEIIANPWREGTYYDANLRSASKRGVDTVMATFMASHGERDAVAAEVARPAPSQAPATRPPVADNDDMAVVCDEELLDAFGPQ